ATRQRAGDAPACPWARWNAARQLRFVHPQLDEWPLRWSVLREWGRNQIVDKRFDERQSMRWASRGAHLLLQTRTRVLNGDLDQLIRSRYPTFRKPAGDDLAPVL